MTGIALTGFVISVVDENRICMRVEDDCIDAVNEIERSVKRNAHYRDVIIINIKKAKFDISVPWSDLQSLIGMHIRANLYYRTYNFPTSKTVIRDDGVSIERHFFNKGIAYRAFMIKNIRE